MTLLVLPPDCTSLDPSISGVLVPRREGRLVTAVSVATNKWPHLTPDATVLRVSTGRRTDDRWQTMTDEDLVAAIRSDLAELIGLEAAPTATSVTRWMHALPQYDVDHAARVDRIEAALRADAPGIHLAGPMLRGLGLPACVRSGRAAAAAALE